MAKNNSGKKTAFQLLTAAVFILAGIVYTYVSASEIMDEYMTKAQVNASWSLPESTDKLTSDNIIRTVYRGWRDEYWHPDDDMGFYGELDLSSGQKICSGNFLSVNYAAANWDENRIIPVSDDFKADQTMGTPFIYINSDALNAKCDNNFIFDGTLKYKKYSTDEEIVYNIGSNPYASASDAVPVSEWCGDTELEIRYFKMADTENEAKLNKIAEELFTASREKWNGSEDQSFSDKRITTSYYAQSEYVDQLNASIYAVYTFKPLNIAVRKNLPVYIIGAAVLVLLEAVLIFMKKHKAE